ncbi:unnamed protein product [Ambrosiozyma monospora]|uniref:Unnamed protein product n=1 Tax=Ambrosiozyma monospora TaxID=43982 RepID=A0A9W6WM49_AMBMO|nr:unnamed protein product [Ambrosiozyma monospora]
MFQKFNKKEAKPFQKSRKLSLGFITALISRPIPKPKSLETQNKTTKSGRPLSMTFIELMQSGQSTPDTDTEKNKKIKNVKRLSLPLPSSNNDLASPLPTPASDGPVTKELKFQPQHVQDAIIDMQFKISQKHT